MEVQCKLVISKRLTNMQALLPIQLKQDQTDSALAALVSLLLLICGTRRRPGAGRLAAAQLVTGAGGPPSDTRRGAAQSAPVTLAVTLPRPPADRAVRSHPPAPASSP